MTTNEEPIMIQEEAIKYELWSEGAVTKADAEPEVFNRLVDVNAHGIMPGDIQLHAEGAGKRHDGKFKWSVLHFVKSDDGDTAGWITLASGESYMPCLAQQWAERALADLEHRGVVRFKDGAKRSPDARLVSDWCTLDKDAMFRLTRSLKPDDGAIRFELYTGSEGRATFQMWRCCGRGQLFLIANKSLPAPELAEETAYLTMLEHLYKGAVPLADHFVNRPKG